MKNDTFRIVQVSDNCFNVQKQLIHEVPWLWWWPWSQKLRYVEWVSAQPIPFPFRTQEHAQKWIDDLRKYPVVVKEAA